MKNQIRVDQKIDIIIGAPGTGKSTYMKQEINKKKSYAEKTGKVYRLGYEYIIIAPTGQAAKNVNGRTIHSLIGFGRTDYNEFAVNGIITDELADYFKRNIKVTKLQDIYIDEVAAIDYNLIEDLDRLLRNALNNYRQAFGGVNIIATGDSMQIQPVNGKTALLYKDLVEKANIKVLKENKRFSGELLDVITDAQKNKYVNFKNIELTNPEDLFLCKHIIVDTNKKRYEYNFKSINYETKQYINIYFDEKEYKNSLENKNVRPEILAPNREIILKSNRAVNATNFEYNGDRAQLTSIGVYDFKENLESSEYEKRLFKSEKPFDIANESEDVVVVFKYSHKCYVPEEDKEYEYNKYALYRAKIVDGTYVCVENLRKTPNAIGGFYEEKLGTPFIDSFAITAHIAQGSTITEKFGIDLSTKSAAASSAYVALTRATHKDNIVFAKMSKSSRRIDKDMWAINDVLISNDSKKFSRAEYTRIKNIIQEYAVPFDKSNSSDLAVQLHEATNWPSINYINERKLMAEATRKMQLDNEFYKEQYHPVGRILVENTDKYNENGKYIGLPKNMSFQDIKIKKGQKWRDGEIISLEYRSTSTMMLCRVNSKYEMKRSGSRSKYQSSTNLYVELLGFTIDVDEVFYDNPERDIQKVLKKIKLLPIQPNMITVSGNNGIHLKFLLKTPILVDKNIRGGYNKSHVDNNVGFELADKIKRIIEYICWYLLLSDELNSLGGKEQHHQGLNQGTTITGSLTKAGKKAVTYLLNSVPVLTPEVLCDIVENYEHDTQMRQSYGTNTKKITEHEEENPRPEFNRSKFLDLVYQEQDIAKIFEETPRERLTGRDESFKEKCKYDKYDKYDFCKFIKHKVIKDTAIAVPNGSQQKQVVDVINLFADILKTVSYSEEYRINYKKAFITLGETASGLSVPKNAFVQELNRLTDFGLPKNVLAEAFEAFDGNKGNTSAKNNAGLNTYRSILGGDLIKKYETAKKQKYSEIKNSFRNTDNVDIDEIYKKVIELLFDYKPAYNSPKYKEIYRELASLGINDSKTLELIVRVDFNSIKFLAKLFADKKIVSKSMGYRYERFLETILKALIIEECRREGINLLRPEKDKNGKTRTLEKLFREIRAVVGECNKCEKLSKEEIAAKTQNFIEIFVSKNSPALLGRLSFYINHDKLCDNLEAFFPCIDWKAVANNENFKEKVELNRKDKLGTNRGTINKALIYTSDNNYIVAYEKLSMPGYSYINLTNDELNAIKAPTLKYKEELTKLYNEDPETYPFIQTLIEVMDNKLGSINDAQKNLPKFKTAQEIIKECTEAKTRRDNYLINYTSSTKGASLIAEIIKVDEQITNLYKNYEIVGMKFDKTSFNKEGFINKFKNMEEYSELRRTKTSAEIENIRKEMYELISSSAKLFNKLAEDIGIVYFSLNLEPDSNKTIIETYGNWCQARRAISSHTSDRINIKSKNNSNEKYNNLRASNYNRQIIRFFDDRRLEKERVTLKYAQNLEKEEKMKEEAAKTQEEIRLAEEAYRNSILPHLELADE